MEDTSQNFHDLSLACPDSPSKSDHAPYPNSKYSVLPSYTNTLSRTKSSLKYTADVTTPIHTQQKSKVAQTLQANNNTIPSPHSASSVPSSIPSTPLLLSHPSVHDISSPLPPRIFSPPPDSVHNDSNLSNSLHASFSSPHDTAPYNSSMAFFSSPEFNVNNNSHNSSLSLSSNHSTPFTPDSNTSAGSPNTSNSSIHPTINTSNLSPVPGIFTSLTSDNFKIQIIQPSPPAHYHTLDTQQNNNLFGQTSGIQHLHHEHPALSNDLLIMSSPSKKPRFNPSHSPCYASPAPVANLHNYAPRHRTNEFDSDEEEGEEKINSKLLASNQFNMKLARKQKQQSYAQARKTELFPLVTDNNGIHQTTNAYSTSPLPPLMTHFTQVASHPAVAGADEEFVLHSRLRHHNNNNNNEEYEAGTHARKLSYDSDDDVPQSDPTTSFPDSSMFHRTHSELLDCMPEIHVDPLPILPSMNITQQDNNDTVAMNTTNTNTEALEYDFRSPTASTRPIINYPLPRQVSLEQMTDGIETLASSIPSSSSHLTPPSSPRPNSFMHPSLSPDPKAFESNNTLTKRTPQRAIYKPPPTPDRNQRKNNTGAPDGLSMLRLHRKSSLYDSKVLFWDTDPVSLPGSACNSPAGTPLRPTTRNRQGSTPMKTQDPNLSIFKTEFTDQYKIGEGAFFECYRVKCIVENHIYAVKKSIRTMKGKKDREAHLKEIQLLHIMHHPNIIRSYKAWQEDLHIYIQLDYCPLNLNHYIQQLVAAKNAKNNNNNNPVSPSSVPTCLDDSILKNVAIQISSALDHIHHKNIVHLDLKPDNLLVSSDGIIKLADFGQAVDLNEQEQLDSCEGDSQYMANLEEYSPHHLSTATDIFSFGLTLLEIASGLMLPKQGQVWHELRSGQAEKHVNQSCSKFASSIILPLLHVQPSARPSATQIIHMLQQAQV